MKTSKTRLERLNKFYVTKEDLKIILGISQKKASELWTLADKQERQEVQFKAHETKVALKTALKIARVDYNFLYKQIKNAQSDQEKSV